VAQVVPAEAGEPGELLSAVEALADIPGEKGEPASNSFKSSGGKEDPALSAVLGEPSNVTGGDVELSASNVTR
jgi:hypothetical protein